MNHVPSTQLLLIEREKEVTGYVEFLLVAAERPSAISANDGEKILPLSLELIHTLKSNMLLLLYSAMEATLVQLLDEMHDAIDSNCDSADRLNSELLRLVLKTFQKDANGAMESQAALMGWCFTSNCENSEWSPKLRMTKPPLI